ATSLISWEQIAHICPKESAAISELLDMYDIRLNDFFRGVIEDMDWHDVVNLRDCHIDVTEMEEAKLEDAIINQLRAHWDALTASFEVATEKEGLCNRITGIIFEENEYENNEKALFDIELGRSCRRPT